MKKMMAAVLAAVLLAGLLPTPAGAAGERVEDMLKQMSLRDKLTQMLMVELRNWDEDPEDGVPRSGFTVMNPQVRQLLGDYRFGGVILFAQNLTDTEQSYYLVRAMQEAAVNGGGLPMLISADQEGGSVYRLATGTALPGNMALGASGAPEYALAAGEILGRELSALGINTNLAPVADVSSNAANPVIGLRSFGDDPERVGQLAAEMITGMARYNVIGCAKHFPGHGDTATDSHYGLPVVDKSLEQLLECELKPFSVAIDRGVEMIMTAHILYPQLETDRIFSRKTGKAEALPATMSDDILTGLLKQKLGFRGVVITDAMNMAGVADRWDSVQAAVLAIQAGADMLCMPCELDSLDAVKNLDALLAGLEAAVAEGEIPMSRIDDAVTRILRLKEKRGILSWSAGNFTAEQALSTVGSRENRAEERRIAAAAVTVVQNRDQVLPLRLTGESRVLMLVPYENEKAQMILGWNRGVEAGLVPEGAQVRTACFQGQTAPEALREELQWADTLIVNSEVTAASRMNGGRWESAFVLNVTDYARQTGKTVIVQSVDKPYDVQCYPAADAVLAVYGCKGSGMDPTEALVGGATGSGEACGPNIIAGIEVILGIFGAEGTLPVDIPRYEGGTFTRDILFPRGFGLHYASLLPEPEPEPETWPTTQPETVPVTHPPLEAPADERPKLPLWAAAAAAAAAVLLLRPKRRRYKPRYRRK